MSYNKHQHDSLEQIINNSDKLHRTEDLIRYTLINNCKINDKLIVLLARILWGRVNNSIRVNNGILDKPHIKAQLITVLCIAFYIDKYSKQNINNINKIELIYLYKLYIYHINIIKYNIKYNTDNYINFLFRCIVNNNFEKIEKILSKIMKKKTIDHNHVFFDFHFNISNINMFTPTISTKTF